MFICKGVHFKEEYFFDAEKKGAVCVQQLELTLRKTKENADLVAKAKANSDQNFNSDPGVVEAFLTTVIDMAQSNADFTTALLKDQNHHSLSALLEMLGYREYLAAVDFVYPNQTIEVEIGQKQTTRETDPMRSTPA